MGKITVFLDSDVIISAILSDKGASFEILKNYTLKKVISQTIKKEVEENARRLGIPQTRSEVFKNINTITIGLKKERLVKDHFVYVSDLEDSHVVAGAAKSKASFLVTFNLKHYKTELIQEKLKIVVLNPGQLLQHLRSQPQI